MRNVIEHLKQVINIEEGENIYENILLQIYLNPCISVRELSRKALLPVPVMTAIKNELARCGAVCKDKGLSLTEGGMRFVEDALGYGNIDIDLYKDAITGKDCFDIYGKHIGILQEIFDNRPCADVTIDQSKCTLETSLKRALLCLAGNSLIGKEILCLGDDDLVCVSLGFLLKSIRRDIHHMYSEYIHVIDIDMRFIEYIEKVSAEWGLPIICHCHDLRRPFPEPLQSRFDCFFTDPPYTMEGLKLFMSRGLTALKHKAGLPVFLSFAHKSPGFALDMFDALVKMGLMICEVIPRFNEYEGAQIIGNTSQMTILRTTCKTGAVIGPFFSGPIYTGELRKTIRIYACTECGKNHAVGTEGHYKTIGQLKESGCVKCGASSFRLRERRNI